MSDTLLNECAEVVRLMHRASAVLDARDDWRRRAVQSGAFPALADAERHWWRYVAPLEFQVAA